MRPVLETTVDDVRAALEFSVLAPSPPMRTVIGPMLERGSGTILFTTGGAAIYPNPARTGAGIAFAGEVAYARVLHDQLRERGIHVGHTAIGGSIAPDGDHHPDYVADPLWRHHAQRGDFQVRLGINQSEYVQTGSNLRWGPEYSRTSMAPSRAASEPIAEARAVASRMSAGATSAMIPSWSSSSVRSSSFSRFLDTRPTDIPSRPKRRAIAAPRLGPAPTMMIDVRSHPPIVWVVRRGWGRRPPRRTWRLDFAAG
jgi:hypothetical protein